MSTGRNFLSSVKEVGGIGIAPVEDAGSKLRVGSGKTLGR